MSKITLIIMAVMLIFLTSCHSDYLHLNYTAHHGAVYNQADSSKIAFVASKSAYRQAEGISRFPDGGIPDYLVQDVSLYVLDTKTKTLDKLIDFNDLVDLIGLSATRWKSEIVFKDTMIYYKILPVSDWNLIANWKKNAKDSINIYALKNKFSKCYSISINRKTITVIDSTSFYSLNQKNKEIQQNSLTELNKNLSNIPLADWNLIIQEIYQKSDEEYIEETIYLKNDSKTSRRAVIEQIISKIDKQEIKTLLNKMEEYKNSLEGLEKTEYEIYSKETYKSIQELL